MKNYCIFSRDCTSCEDGILVFMSTPEMTVMVTCTCCSVSWPSPHDARYNKNAIVAEERADFSEWRGATSDEVVRAGFGGDIHSTGSW